MKKLVAQSISFILLLVFTSPAFGGNRQSASRAPYVPPSADPTSWSIFCGDNAFWTNNVQPEALKKFWEFNRAGEQIKSVSYSLSVPKMPSESFKPEFHQVDEFNFDSYFVNSDNIASQFLGQGRHPHAKSSHCPKMGRTACSEESTWLRQADSFGEFCCLIVIGARSTSTVFSCTLIPMMQATDLRN